MNTLATRSDTCSHAARAAASSPPPASTSAARTTAMPAANEALPVSMSSTGTVTDAAATCAAFTVPEYAAPTWIERMVRAALSAACS